MAKDEKKVEQKAATPAQPTLRRVEFVGKEGEAFTAHRRVTLPAHGKPGSVIAVEASLAASLVRYYPDRYQFASAPPAAQEG